MMTGNPEQPEIFAGLLAITRRELLLAWRRPGDILTPLFFFAMVCTLFPLAVGPSAEQLIFSGPGVLWVAALLATLLSLNSLFLSDHEDGSIDQHQLLDRGRQRGQLEARNVVAHLLAVGCGRHLRYLSTQP